MRSPTENFRIAFRTSTARSRAIMCPGMRGRFVTRLNGTAYESWLGSRWKRCAMTRDGLCLGRVVGFFVVCAALLGWSTSSATALPQAFATTYDMAAHAYETGSHPEPRPVESTRPEWPTEPPVAPLRAAVSIPVSGVAARTGDGLLSPGPFARRSIPGDDSGLHARAARRVERDHE